MSNINSPCLYLKLDTVVNDHVFDSAGNLLVGTANRTTTAADPTFGSCLSFNGSSSDVIVSNLYQGRSFPPTPGVFSASVWVNPSALHAPPSPGERTNVFYSLVLNGTTLLLEMSLTQDGELVFTFDTGEQVSFGALLETNTWYYVGMSLSGTELIASVNGSKLPTMPLSSASTAASATNQLLLGKNNGNLYFAGKLAHARVYMEALSNQELAQVMANDLAGGMLLHLPMAEASSTSTPNYTLYPEYTAQPIGSPTLEASDQFGTTMHFNGSSQYLALNGLVCTNTQPWTAITIECWVKVTQVQNGAILSYDPSNFFELGVTASGGTAHVSWTTVDTNNVQNVMAGTANLADGQWHYVAVTYRAGDGQKTIFVDGVVDATSAGVHGGLCLGTSVSNTTRYGAVGLSGRAFFYNQFSPTYSHFAGNLCQLRLYSSALTQADIERDMGASLIASYSFWKGYPLLFTLEEEFMDNTIYIYDNPEGHSLDVVLRNTTASSPISFPALTSVNSGSYQLALTFRPGVLSQASLEDIGLANAGWRMSDPTTLEDGSVTLYFAASSPYTLQPMADLRLTLTGVSADPAGGARGTRVQLIYQGVSYVDSNSPLSGQASANVKIVNHEGSSEMPLIAAFSVTDTVYNGDVNFQNQLSIRLTNIQSPIGGGGGVSFKARQTRLVVAFQGASQIASNDPGPINTWDVIGTYQPNLNSAYAGGVNWERVMVEEGGGEYYWTFSPETDFTLMPGQQLQIDITGLKAQATQGYSNLYLRYENLPNFWDGEMTLQVLKSNVFAAGGKLGVGTGSPQVPLQVNGGTTAAVETANSGTLILGDAQYAQLALSLDTIAAKASSTTPGALHIKSSEVTIHSTATIQSTLTVQNGNLVLNSPSNNVISFSSAGAFKSGIVADNNANLSLRTGGNSSAYDRIAINSTGNVGMGAAPVSTIGLLLAGSQGVASTTASGSLVIGNTSGVQLAMDNNSIWAKSNASTLSSLTIQSSNLAVTSSALTYKATSGSSSRSLSMNYNTLSIPSGMQVLGIPVMEVKTTATISISSGTGSGGRSATGTVVFSSPPASKPTAMLQYWKIRYSGDSDHELKMIWAKVDVTSWSTSSNTATVTATIMLSDATDSDGDDNYEGEVTAVVIANLSKSVGY